MPQFCRRPTLQRSKARCPLHLARVRKTKYCSRSAKRVDFANADKLVQKTVRVVPVKFFANVRAILFAKDFSFVDLRKTYLLICPSLNSVEDCRKNIPNGRGLCTAKKQYFGRVRASGNFYRSLAACLNRLNRKLVDSSLWPYQRAKVAGSFPAPKAIEFSAEKWQCMGSLVAQYCGFPGTTFARCVS
jgi:hypothetical protein